MKPRLSDGQSVYLDFVRGLSAFAVLVGHTFAYIPNPPALGTFYPVQSYAVVVFFVLSGFLICLSTVSKPGYTYGAYLIDRFSRVYTALVPTILLILIVDTLMGLVPAGGWSMTTILANFGLLMGIPFERVFPELPWFQPLGTGRPLWTVAVEWWLYVAFGFMFFMTRLRTISWIVALVLTPISFLVVLRYGSVESLALVWFISAAAAIPILRLDKDMSRKIGPPILLFWGGVAIWKFLILRTIGASSAVNFYDAHFMYFTTVAIFAIMICVKGYDILEKTMLAIRPFARWFADISYSLYLTHYTLLVAFSTKFGMSWHKAMIFIILATLFAWVFTILFDKQYRKVSRFLKRILLRQSSKTDKSLREQTAAVSVIMSDEARKNAEDGVAPA